MRTGEAAAPGLGVGGRGLAGPPARAPCPRGVCRGPGRATPSQRRVGRAEARGRGPGEPPPGRRSGGPSSPAAPERGGPRRPRRGRGRCSRIQNPGVFAGAWAARFPLGLWKRFSRVSKWPVVFGETLTKVKSEWPSKCLLLVLLWVLLFFP